MPVMDRLWRLLAHSHGQTLNYSKLAGAIGLSVPTLRKYLAVLEQTYMVRLLPPYEAKGWVPDFVEATQRDFSTCPNCSKIYWNSTHVSAMLDRLETMGIRFK